MVGMRSKKDEEEKKADTLGGCDDREVFADDPVDLDPSPNNKDDDNDKGHVDTTSEKKGAIDDKATAKDDARNAPVVNGVDTNDDGKDVVGDEDGDNEDDDSEDDDVEMDGWNASKGAVDVPTVGWWRQFVVCVWYKNTSLLQRKPIHLAVLLLSGVAAVLTAWPAGRDYTASEAIYPQTLTTCGTIPHEFFDTFNRSSDTFYDDVSKVKLSLNEPWRNGLPVAVLSLGPLLFAIFAFLIVHDELQLQMLGILRGLGLRDSVYWVSWYVPFAVLAFINSVLAAATAKLIPVHVFEATYYAGIMGAFFFLQLALLGASFFLAAVTGIRKRGAIWWILLMMIPLWIPFFVMNFNFYGLSAYEVSGSSYSTTPHGLFWMNRVTNVNLVSYNFNDDFYNNDGSFSDDETSSNQTNSFNGTNIFNGDARGPEQTSTRCNIPLLSEEEGNKFKTDDERLKVTPDQFFLGCFFSAGFGSSSWAPVGKTNAGLAVWWFIPYFHFNTIWGNFCGLTGNPSTEFTVKHAGLSAGQLARAGLPAPLTDTNSSGTTLFPQGSMLQETIPDSYVCETYGVEGYCEIFKSNCPAENLSSGNFNFCTDTGASSCTVATSSPADGISVNAMFVMLLALSIVYVFMAAYWGIAFVGGAGTHPFYFIFMRNYWLGVDTRRQSPGRVGELDSEVGRNGSASQRNAAVQIHGVSKSYGSVDALKPVSFEMALGEVTALLGHNGAGKTTLSKVLTCEFAATGGDITVFGHSVKDDPYAVRRLVGNCKQDDYLWPSLTAKEHLDVFGGLRGVDMIEHDEIVLQWLESVDLETVQHQLSSQFSGGMKRRLSLALSTIGSRLLIVLDEPTTGMDPVSRRFVWKHINEIKKGRVVLLTTHAMEEADLLADMVAIMRKGELAAWGSPLQLKTAHGSALQFSVIVDKADVASTVEKIQSRFIGVEQWIVVNAGEAGNVTVSIKQIQEHSTDEGVCVEALTNFVAWLEDSETSGVTEYGFSNSSLEEVFLKVTEGDTEDLQTHANVIVQHEDNTVESLSLPPSEFSNNVAAYQSQLSVLGQVQALVWQYFIRSWTGSRSIGNWVMFGTFISISLLLVVWLSSVGSPILVVPVIFASLILLSICNGMYADRAEGLFLLMQTHGLLRASYLIGTTAYSLSIALIYHIILMTLLYLTPFFREPIPCDPLKEINQYCDTFPKFGKRNQIDLSMAQDVSWLVEGVDVSILTDDWGSIRILAYPSPSGYWMVFCAAAFFSLTIPGVALAGSYFPGHKFALVLIVTLLLGASITPMVVSLLAKLNIIILESDQDVEACLNDLLPRRVCNETVISVNTSDIFPASASEDFLNCVGLAINDLSNLCIPPYASLLPQFGLFQMLSLALNANIKFHTVPAEFAETVLLPSIKGGHCSGNTCSFPALRTIYWKFAGWETLGAVILITVGILVVLLVAFPNTGVQNVKSLIKSYFEHVKSLMFCQLAGKETRPFPKEQFQKREEVLLERESVKKIVQPFMSTSDSELPHIADHSIIPREELPPVLMYKLSKVYPSFGRLPPKVALKSLDLHVPKGQVLGFLGKNGAGKTTALKILAGAHDASSGIGLVSGYDVDREKVKVFERLGNCPQFDVIWPKLSVKEHLLFFAMLKGLPRDKVQIACQNIASAVGLGAETVYTRQAEALSGGMRRRLSIAISLLGAPSVLVLDEPTTGLDPSTRNTIWDLVNSFANAERAIVITTHMMLEADTLCNRIAIVAKGELVVVASQQRLKDKFGSGYLLQLNLVKSSRLNQRIAMNFVHKHLHPDAILNTKDAKTLHVNLPRDMDLKQAFSALYNPALRPECINQFLMSQSSLEDVFIALG